MWYGARIRETDLIRVGAVAATFEFALLSTLRPRGMCGWQIHSGKLGYASFSSIGITRLFVRCSCASSVSNEAAASVELGAAVSDAKLAAMAALTMNALSPLVLLDPSSNRGWQEDILSYSDGVDDFDSPTADSIFDYSEGNDKAEDGNDIPFAELSRREIGTICQDVADAVADCEKSRKVRLVGELYNLLNKGRGVDTIQLFGTGTMLTGRNVCIDKQSQSSKLSLHNETVARSTIPVSREWIQLNEGDVKACPCPK